MKRAMDTALVLISIPFLVPFFLLIGSVVALDRHSPFFRHQRIGMNGKPYWIWKFRTMRPNAEEELKFHLDANPKLRAEWERRQKLENDPRITKFGRVLRRNSLDELPQLIDVMKGEMSLVGPRPIMLGQKALYPGQTYYKIRPGVTGSWQVSSKNASTFAERAHFLDTYEAEISFTTDAKILMRTVGVVLRGTGL